MIQIDFSLIIMLINFALLLWVLNRYLFKAVGKFLEERRTRIEQDMADAETSKAEAADLVEQRATELQATHDEARHLKDEARKQAEQQKADILAEAKKQSEHERELALQQIEHESEEANKALQGHMAELVSMLASKVLDEKLDDERDVKLINNVIGQRGGK